MRPWLELTDLHQVIAWRFRSSKSIKLRPRRNSPLHNAPNALLCLLSGMFLPSTPLEQTPSLQNNRQTTYSKSLCSIHVLWLQFSYCRREPIWEHLQNTETHSTYSVSCCAGHIVLRIQCIWCGNVPKSLQNHSQQIHSQINIIRTLSHNTPASAVL